MGAADQIDIRGAKGGDAKPKSPTEAADSLRSTNLAKILIAVGEGEFDGVPSAQNIYLDNTPINDASGNVNFPNVKWEWRTGSVDQSYIPGIPAVENETTVNVELRSDTAWVRSLTNTQLSAVRVRLAWPALQQQDENGNVGGYRIEYAIDVATDGGAYQQVLLDAVDGKTTTRYERSSRIDLPAATSGWQIRVRRLTPNKNTNKIADTMLVAGYTEVIDAKLRYPNTALLYIEFDAEQFTNIPAVTVDCNGRKWQVPSNYDPVTRSYTGVWDGTFKQAWTNNPAWVVYGICTVDRFGMGKRIKPFMVDKWELYRIAQYCDQLVPNGVGGQEPRFLCDMNLQGKSDAWTLLRDISAIYRGMTYWAEGQIVMQADMPRAQDFDYVFTRANVIDGKFSYGSASTKTRYTRAIVSYDNPANNYDTDVTAFADPDLQRRFGDKPVEISAIGCTRASEAQRRGKWAVMSNNQDRTVTFKTGMEGEIPLPGYIIPIADSLLAGREIGGRISASAGRVVTLDRDTLAKVGDRLIINLPSGKAEGRTVQFVAGRAVTVTTAYSETPTPQLQWALDADDLAIPLYRVLSRKRTTEGDYEIAALQYEPSKFAYIDTGARLEDRPISVIPITVVPAPASVTLTSNSAIDQGIAITTMTITWPAVNGAVGYDVEWRKDNGNWIKVQRTGATSVDITGIYAGAYLARVRAVSAYDISSNWRSSMLTQLNGKEGLPPAVTSLTTESLIFGIGVKWTFPPGAEDTQRTELWYSEAPRLDSAAKLADLAYPQSDYTMQGLRAGQTFFFWARLVDRTGNIGPWYPVAPTVVNGHASADADDILDYLTGQITESELGKELLSEIAKIDGNGPDSVNERLGQVRSDLTEQITDVGNTVAEVKGELQAQIDQVAIAANALPYAPTKTYAKDQVTVSGGVLYQAVQAVPVNTPPPNTAYWLNVGQAVQTANGLAARVTTSEQKITSIEGVNTAQSEQISGLKTSLDGKADSSAVQSLSSRVTTAENTISSQGSAITGLNNSLTTTNTNVTAAQNAANAANTLAGGKGKVIVQSSAPAAADQLAQNLWIDTTNNANTPKRWTGSAWAAVTDKVATDAAAAAAAANTLAQTKADASAVNSLTTRVTSAEGSVTSQGNRVTSLENSVNSTTNGLATKASSAAVDNLSGRVTQTETGLTSVSGQLTQLNNNIGDMGGENLLFNPSFDREGTTQAGVADGWYKQGPNVSQATFSLVTSNWDPSGKAQRIESTTLSSTQYDELTIFGPRRPQVKAGDVLTMSCRVRGTSGARFEYFIVATDALGNTVTGTYSGSIVMNGNWSRPALTATMPANTGLISLQLRLFGTSSVSSAFMELDECQVERGSVVTGWRDNGDVMSSDQAATSTAVSALQSNVSQQGSTLTSVAARTTSLENSVNSSTSGLSTKASASALDTVANRVTVTEGAITSQASSVTRLDASIKAANSAGANIVANATFDPAYNQMGLSVVASNASGVPANCPFKYVARLTARDHVPSIESTPFAATKPGEVWRLSALVACASGSAVFNHYIQNGSAVATVSGTGNGGGTQAAISSWTRVTWDYTVPANVFFVRPFLQVDQSASSPTTVWYATDWHMENITVAKVAQSTADANASALTSTNATVTQQGNTITSQGSQITNLNTVVGNQGSTLQAQGQAISDTKATVTQQGNTITSHASQITNLNSVVNNQGAALQVQGQALSDTNGKVSSSYTVKLGVMADGRKWAAGFGIGLDNSSGATQSQFVVSADTFAVLNADSSANGTFTSPFTVSGGQVFIADAVIKKATITNALVGQSVYSQTLTSYGQPVMISDYNQGQITIQNKATQGKYLILREDGLFAVSGGVVILELKV